jgi:delta-1-pyrroline-5-carboxylate synthetase
MMHQTPTTVEEPRSRAALRMARRVVIKAGTSVVANADGSPSLTRLGSIVEQIAELHQAGVEVIFVSSGAVGMGRNLLKKQGRLNMSFMDLHHSPNPTSTIQDSLSTRLTPSASIHDILEDNEHIETSAAKSYAAAGQFELMSLYQSLFSPKNVTASQILLTQADFQNESHMKNLSFAIERLLKVGIVPIINENDAVFVTGVNTSPVFADNDSLAALCAHHFSAEVLLILTDVEGVFTLPPSNPKAKLISFYHSNSSETIGTNVIKGRGGMKKIGAAEMAVSLGSTCTACVVACVETSILNFLIHPREHSLRHPGLTWKRKLQQNSISPLRATMSLSPMSLVIWLRWPARKPASFRHYRLNAVRQSSARLPTLCWSRKKRY